MSDPTSIPPQGGQAPRNGRVVAPIGALRRGIVPVEPAVEGETPPVSPDLLVRASRHAPSNRGQAVFALGMLMLGALTGLLMEPQWRDGRSILPATVVELVKAIPGLGPWFAASLETEVAEAAARPKQLPSEAPPATDDYLPNLLMQLTPDEARVVNASMPVSTTRGPAAAPFQLPHTDPVLRQRAVQCLTAAVYYEAGYETPQGQAAVAQVVLNRMRHPAYPKSVCGVVFEGSERSTGCQFTFTCDGALRRAPDPVRWRRAQIVAEAALNGAVEPSVGLATHYHADYVVPLWATKLTKARVVGAHIFYRWNGGWGSPAAFTGQYAGTELQIAGLWPIESEEAETFAEIPPLPPTPPVLLASLERPAVVTDAAAAAAATAPVVIPPAPPPPVLAAPPPPVTATPAPAPAPAPKVRPGEPRSRPRIPVPSGW